MSESTDNPPPPILPNTTDSIYYACNDPLNPICRQFVNQGTCRRRSNCRFYHPRVITDIIRRKAGRELGHCYCGSLQRKLINRRAFNIRDNERCPIFFVVCGRTGRSMKRCM